MAGGVEPYLVGEAAGGADGESVVVLGLFADEDGCGGEGVGAERLRRARRAKSATSEECDERSESQTSGAFVMLETSLGLAVHAPFSPFWRELGTSDP